MRILFILFLTFSLSPMNFALGRVQSLQNISNRALRSVSNVMQFNPVPVRQKAEAINQRIQEEINHEYNAIAQNEMGTLPGQDYMGIKHGELGLKNPETLMAEEKLRARQEATECHSQNLAAVLQESLISNCGIPEMQKACMNFQARTQIELDEADRRQKQLMQAKLGRIVNDQLAVLQNELVEDTLPTLENLMLQCRQSLRKTEEPNCLNVYEQVFDQSMQYNLTYLCLPETVNDQVEEFIRNARMGGGISNRVQQAQAQYVEGRTTLIGLTQLVESLTNYLVSAIASNPQAAAGDRSL